MASESGALSVGQRLDRIEDSLREILRRLEVYATEGDMRELKGRVDELMTKGSLRAQEALRLAERSNGRVEVIERNYVGRATITAAILGLGAQGLVIVGLGLGLIYELLRHQ